MTWRPPGPTSPGTRNGSRPRRRGTRRGIKLLADENVARQKVELLREQGLDIVSIADLGLAGQGVSDPSVLELAVAQDRIVLTHNGKDFRRLHKQSPDHAGIVILPDDIRHRRIAQAVVALLRSSEGWSGRLVRLHRPPP